MFPIISNRRPILNKAILQRSASNLTLVAFPVDKVHILQVVFDNVISYWDFHNYSPATVKSLRCFRFQSGIESRASRPNRSLFSGNALAFSLLTESKLL
jgi:hypothetical protein